MKTSNSYITQSQLRRELRMFKAEMLLLIEDFAMYGAWMSNQDYTYFPKTEIVEKLYLKRNRITRTRKFKKEERERMISKIDWYFNDLKSNLKKSSTKKGGVK